MTKRSLVFLAIALLLIAASAVSAQRVLKVDCPPYEYLHSKLPVLPEGEYPIIGFFISDAVEGSFALSDITFNADPNFDGCFEKYKVDGRYTFTHNGGSMETNNLKVWKVDQTTHLYIGS